MSLHLTAVTTAASAGQAGRMSIRPHVPAIIVEPTLTGWFAVRVRPILSHRELERAYPAAWQALEWADLVGDEMGWPVLDRTGMDA